MTSQAPGTSEKESTTEINIDPSLTADQRRCVEQSVAQMIARSREAITRRRAAEAERSKPLREANAALIKRLENHPDAALVLEALRTTSRPAGGDQADLAAPLEQGRGVIGSVTIELRQGLELHGTPFHFDWKWKDKDGVSFPTMRVSRETGVAKLHVTLEAGGDAASWVTAHAGVGIALTTDREVAVIGRALRSTRTEGHVFGGGWGGSAASEGGTEITVFRDGNFVTSATGKEWRIRVGTGDWAADHDSEGFDVSDPIEAVWTMVPGSIYTFNLGAWIYAEAHNGSPFPPSPSASAESAVDANLMLLIVNR